MLTVSVIWKEILRKGTIFHGHFEVFMTLNVKDTASQAGWREEFASAWANHGSLSATP
jgi:hypothetical protein